MIDPRSTNIIGQRVLILKRATNPSEQIGRGIVRVVDHQGGCFALLIEAVGALAWFGVSDGGLFEVSTAYEDIEVVVDHEVPDTRSSDESGRGDEPPPVTPVNTTTKHLTYIEADWGSFQRGGSTRTAVCLCSWRGPQRGTLEMVFDDAATHERWNQK